MKYLIDTNIFLRVLVPENKKSFSECANIINQVKNGSIEAVTTSATLTELALTLRSYYKLKKDEIVDALKSVIGINGLSIVDDYNSEKSIDLFEKNNVKFVDCLIASIDEVQGKKWTVISYDKDFDTLNILRKEPGEMNSN